MDVVELLSSHMSQKIDINYSLVEAIINYLGRVKYMCLLRLISHHYPWRVFLFFLYFFYLVYVYAYSCR